MMPTHTSPTDPGAPFATQPNRTEHFRTLPNAGDLSLIRLFSCPPG